MCPLYNYGTIVVYKTIVCHADAIWEFATRVLFERHDKVHIKIRGQLRFCFLDLFARKLALHKKPISVGDHRTISVRGPRHTAAHYMTTIVSENMTPFVDEVHNVELHVLTMPFATVVKKPIVRHPSAKQFRIVILLTAVLPSTTCDIDNDKLEWDQQTPEHLQKKREAWNSLMTISVAYENPRRWYQRHMAPIDML